MSKASKYVDGIRAIATQIEDIEHSAPAAPRLDFRNYNWAEVDRSGGLSLGTSRLNADEAIVLANWILETFSESTGKE